MKLTIKSLRNLIKESLNEVADPARFSIDGKPAVQHDEESLGRLRPSHLRQVAKEAGLMKKDDADLGSIQDVTGRILDWINSGK